MVLPSSPNLAFPSIILKLEAWPPFPLPSTKFKVLKLSLIKDLDLPSFFVFMLRRVVISVFL